VRPTHHFHVRLDAEDPDKPVDEKSLIVDDRYLNYTPFTQYALLSCLCRGASLLGYRATRAHPNREEHLIQRRREIPIDVVTTVSVLIRREVRDKIPTELQPHTS
jgi:hypothetical protein